MEFQEKKAFEKCRTLIIYFLFRLDMHYYMLHQIHRRAADGIHWNAEAVRMQVNVFLTHFCLSRKIPLLNRWKKSRNLEMKENCLLEEAKLALKAASTDYLNRQRNRKRLQKHPQRTFAQAHRRKHYQGYRNRYNLINRPSSSCSLCEIKQRSLIWRIFSIN